MKKIECGNCGQMVFASRFCSNCRSPLHQQDRPDAGKTHRRDMIGKLNLIARADEAHGTQQKTVLARFKVFPGAGAAPGGAMAVRARERSYMFSPSVREPKVLGPGRYQLGRLGISQEGKQSGIGAVVCTVEEVPQQITLCMPDRDFLADARRMASDLSKAEYKSDPEKSLSLQRVIQDDIRAALGSLALRTANNLLGSVIFGMEIRVTDPPQLIRSFATRTLESDSADSTEDLEANRRQRGISVEESEVERKKRGVFGKFWNMVKTGQWEDEEQVRVAFSVTPHLTFSEIYPFIRHELASALRTTISEHDAETLHRNIDARHQIYADLQRSMETTLGRCGLSIERVTSFQFLSSEYEELLEQQGETAIAEESLANEEKAADVHARQLEIEQRRQNATIEHEGEVTRSHISEDIKTHREMADFQRQVAEEEAKKRGIEGDSDRDEQEKNERLAMQLDEDRGRLADRREEDREQAKLQRRGIEQEQNLRMLQAIQQGKEASKDAEHRRKLEADESLLERIAHLPRETQMMILARDAPHLAKAAEAMFQAQGRQETIEARQETLQLLQHVQGQNTEQVMRVLETVLKKKGDVEVELAKHPQLPEQGTSPDDPPKSDSDSSEASE